MKNILSLVLVGLLPLTTLAAPTKIKGEKTLQLQNTQYLGTEPWSMEEKSNTHILTPPETDLTMYFSIVDFKGKPAEVALKAWKEFIPDFKFEVEQELHPPASNGWEAVHKIVYKVPVKDSRLVATDMLILKGKAYLIMIDGKYATIQKRGAQLQTMASSWKPKELIEEKLGDRTPAKLGPKEIKELDSFIKNTMRELQIPGVQVAFVQDGKVAWENSYGVHEKGSKDKVTKDTIFMIGSTTKPLTTLLQARLVDQDKLDWDDAVRKFLPDFSLADSSATRKLELRHTACACTGMPRRDLDFIFEFENVTPEQRIATLKTMSPTTGFGETFQYSNLLVAAGGYAAAHKLYPDLTFESAYEKAMREEVFNPLGFVRTRVRPFSGDRLASPHALDMNGRMQPIPQRMDDMVYGVAPAGAVWSNATDMARYVLFELGNGKLDGVTILSEENVKERRTPGVKVDDTAQYGLGLFYDDVKGLKTWGHGGNTLGFTSDMVFLPDHQIGWVLLNNAGGAPLRNLFSQKVFEVLFKAEKQTQKRLAHITKTRREVLAKARSQISTSPSQMKWIKELVGKWQEESLGGAEIKATKKGFVADFGEWQSDIANYKEQAKTFVLVTPPWGGELNFQLQDDGTLLLDAGQQKYSFKKVQQ